MTDLTSGITSYGLGLFALVFQQDLSTYAAIAALILVVVRIIGDLAKAVRAWQEVFDNDSDEDQTG